VPNAIHDGNLPCMVNFLNCTTYSSLTGQGNINRGDLALTMRLYLGTINTVTTMENKADEFIPLVESAFLGNSTLSYNNSPLNGILEFQLLSNSGLVSQRYVVNSGSDSPYYAVVEFPATIRLQVRIC
jgi:hypothetical protein